MLETLCHIDMHRRNINTKRSVRNPGSSCVSGKPQQDLQKLDGLRADDCDVCLAADRSVFPDEEGRGRGQHRCRGAQGVAVQGSANNKVSLHPKVRGRGH